MFARRLLRRLRPGRRGTSTVEFALVAPVMLTILLGLCDLAPTTMARFKFGNTTQSVADLATQNAQLQLSDMVDLFAGGGSLLTPFSSSTLSMRITNIASDGNGNAFVYWSCANGSFTPTPVKTIVTTTPTGGSVSNVLWLYNLYVPPYGQNGTDTSYVTVEAAYIYTAPAQFILKTPQNMTLVNYMVPRVSTYIGFPWDGNVNHTAPKPSVAKTANSVTLSNGAVCKYLS